MEAEGTLGLVVYPMKPGGSRGSLVIQHPGS